MAARALRDALLARLDRGERAADSRLRLIDAAATWLDEPVADLRPRTRECYRNAVNEYLLPPVGSQRLDSISPDDLAGLVRKLREVGLSEASIVIVVGVANRITAAIAGTRSASRMREDAPAGSIELTGADIEEIDSALAANVHEVNV